MSSRKKKTAAVVAKRRFSVQNPAYMRDFSCAGSACPDHCCKHWHVALTRPEVEFYREKVDDPELKAILASSVKETPSGPDRSESRFGHIQMTTDGLCPVLSEDGLCRVQMRLGHSALSQVCGTYPRLQVFVNQGNPAISHYGTLSCPEVARLAMLGPGSLTLGGAEVDADALRNPATAMIDGRRNAIAARHFGAIREAIRALIDAHASDLDSGIFAVLMLARDLGQHAGPADAEASWLAERVALYSSRDFAAGFRGLRPDPSIAFSILQALVRLRLQVGGIPRPYLDVLADSLAGFSFDPRDEAASLAAYARARDAIAGRVFEQPWAMRNVVISMLEASGFPARDGSALWGDAVTFAVRYSVLRLMATGLAARQRSALDTQAATRCVYVYARLMDHSRSFLEASIQMLERNGLSTVGGLALLIRG